MHALAACESAAFIDWLHSRGSCQLQGTGTMSGLSAMTWHMHTRVYPYGTAAAGAAYATSHAHLRSILLMINILRLGPYSGPTKLPPLDCRAACSEDKPTESCATGCGDVLWR